MSSALLNDLRARGLVFQVAGEEDLPRWLDGGVRTVYCGFDPTADSLHIGSLVPLLMLRRFQLAGHKPLVLVGGATGLIGDPSFKAQERQLNTPDVISGWIWAVPMAPTARPNRPAQLDCSGHSDLCFCATLERSGVTFGPT